MRTSTERWNCDGCTTEIIRDVEQGLVKPPAGWRQIKISVPDERFDMTLDACSSCAGKVVDVFKRTFKR